MKHSRRGAAKISVVWMITVLVLFFVAFMLAVVAFQDQSTAEAEAEAARSLAAAEVERADVESNALTDLARAVGWYDRESAAPRADATALGEALGDAKTTFGLGDDVADLETLLPQAKAAHLVLKKEINTLKSQITDLESEKSSAASSSRSSLGQKDGEIADLRRQLSDAEAAAASKQEELEGRVADLRTRNNELDAEKRRLQADSDEVARSFDSELKSARIRADTLGAKLNFINKSAETADGKVLNVSKELPLAFINLGANNRISTGMRFRVVSGKTGGQTKGWATVGNVEATMSEVHLTDVVDRFNPVVAGDQLFNPLYDPRTERYAVLAGRFSGKYNEKEITGFLAGMNIQVEKNLSIHTDYLIVGSELFTDPDTEEPLDEPRQVEDLPVYKDAQAQGGVSIVPLKDVREYFKF